MTATLADIRSRLDSGSVTSEALVESVLDAGHGAGAVERPIARSRSLARASDARRRAGRSRGPLDGVPFGVKVNFDVQGEPTTSGLMPAGPPAASDGRSVALLVAEGAIPAIGTTMAPAALGTVTPHPDIGLCQNPRDASRGAGGSSGGSAAAVGSGLVPFALGSDTLGSVRIPAAHCGVVGWIPTHGSVSTRGLVPLAPPLDSVGLLCAAAHDLQWLVAPLFAPDPRHPWWRARPGFVPPHRPRIADCVLGERADERGRQATEALIDEFVAIGAVRTTTVALTVEPRVVRRRALLLAEICAAVTFREAREAGHLPNHADTLVDYGARASGTRVWETIEWLVEVRRLIRLGMREVDYVVLPTTPEGAPAVGEDPESVADLTAWVNVAGLPCVALPVGDRSVQVVGRPGADLDLVRWAALLSAQLPKAAGRLSMNAVTPS